jgi:hypothetical protein
VVFWVAKRQSHRNFGADLSFGDRLGTAGVVIEGTGDEMRLTTDAQQIFKSSRI